MLAHSFFEGCPERVELDFGSLVKETKVVSTFAKLKPVGPSDPAKAVNQAPVETVDLDQKPSLLGKRTGM